MVVDRPFNDRFLKDLEAGVYLKELDVTTRPCQVRQTGRDVFHIILTQGLNRQIRRMCQALGYRVVTLQRIRIMNIRLGNLPVGQWRHLTKEELEEMGRLIREGSKSKIIRSEEKTWNRK